MRIKLWNYNSYEQFRVECHFFSLRIKLEISIFHILLIEEKKRIFPVQTVHIFSPLTSRYINLLLFYSPSLSPFTFPSKFFCDFNKPPNKWSSAKASATRSTRLCLNGEISSCRTKSSRSIWSLLILVSQPEIPARWLNARELLIVRRWWCQRRRLISSSC